MTDRLFDIEIGPTVEGMEVIEVSVYYTLGGLNFMSYKCEPRGYYVMVMPCTIGDGFRSYRIGYSKTDLGFKQLIEGTERLNRKRLEQLRAACEEVDRERVKQLVLDGQKLSAFNLFIEAINRREAA